ncbi:hypothetical protein RFI_00537, partial [Reticulomyxa filosa]
TIKKLVFLISDYFVNTIISTYCYPIKLKIYFCLLLNFLRKCIKECRLWLLFFFAARTNMMLNPHNVHYLPNNHCSGQGQQRLAHFQQPVQSYVVPNYHYPNSTSTNVGHVGHLCLANNDYNAMISLSMSQQLQSELSKAYQLKQEQLRVSQQRHVEEMHHMNSHPHIRHHCAIIDRLDKEDSQYADFSRKVKDNESQFEASNDTFDNKHYIAQKMNAQRLSALGFFFYQKKDIYILYICTYLIVYMCEPFFFPLCLAFFFVFFPPVE